jgi:hypothetical protein
MFVIRSYTRSGKLLAEFHRAKNISVAYSLNGGKALSFDIALNDPKATREFLDRSNLIIAHSDELESWSGRIVRRSWSPNAITVTCYPPSDLLNKRRASPAKLENKTGGELFTYLINEANKRVPSGIVLGDIYAGGKKFSLEFEDDVILDKINELMDDTTYEYKITMLAPGLWQADMSERFGADLTETVVVFVGVDTEDTPQYEEDDIDFANAVTVTGKEAESDGELTDSSYSKRPKAEYVDWASVDKYGLMEDHISKDDITDLATLMQIATTTVEERKWPKRIFSFNLNRRRGLWSQFTDGDIICVQAPYYGFTGMAIPFRVLGREVNEDTGSMTVAGEVVVGEKAQLLKMFSNAHYGTGIDFIYPAPTP